MPPRRRSVTLIAALLAIAIAVPAAAAAAAEGDAVAAARYLDSVRAQPAKLRALLLDLPKGADLHNHLSGAVTTETLIRLAVADGLCIETATSTARTAATPCPPGQRPAADTTTDRAFFQQVLQAWSMEGFVPGAQTGHDHFFATFGRFGAATARKGDMLAEVASINARQRVLYLETLVSRQGSAVVALARQVGFDPDFAALRGKLLAGGMAQIVRGAMRETDADFARFDQLLGCKARRPQPGCNVTIRFDYQVGRATDPATVFTNLMLGFELQRADRRYVGVNLVQPEDNPVALRDYTLQMQMIGYLRSVYPGTHVTLHAGELTPGLVRDPADITFHIRQAVEIAGAERIGHGVSLVHETGYPELLREMARKPRARRGAADEQRADPRRLRAGAPVLALPRGGRAARAGDRRPRRVAHRHHARVRVRHEGVRPALSEPAQALARVARARLPAGAQPVALTGRLHPRGRLPARHAGLQASEPAVRKAAAHEPQGERAVEARGAAARVRTPRRPLAVRGCVAPADGDGPRAEPQVTAGWTGVRPGRRSPAPPLA